MPRRCASPGLYVAGDATSQKVGRVQIGREMVVAEKSGNWLRVYANTDTQQEHQQDSDTPWIGDPDSTPPPISGWMEARGVVIENTPSGDQILLGEAAGEEALASEPRGPANAATSARLLYRRLVGNVPQLAARRRSRMARRRHSLADSKGRRLLAPLRKERDAYMREQIDEYEMKRVLSSIHTRARRISRPRDDRQQALRRLAGRREMPGKGIEIYEKYAADFPDGPRTARALYEAAYRQAVLVDMFNADGADKKAAPAKTHARELAQRLKDKFPQSDYASRAAALIFRLDEGIPFTESTANKPGAYLSMQQPRKLPAL